MSPITAPYGFAPFSATVATPEWLKDKDGKLAGLHDVPFKDGISGTLELSITAETPIFTRGQDPQRFFSLLDGRHAIPGTSLKGALRNIIEIASFGWLNRVNNHRFAIRDLQNRRLYGQYMAAIEMNPRTKKKEPIPLVNAGWLSRVVNGDTGDESYEITSCDFGKVEYGVIEQLAVARGLRGYNPGKKQPATEKLKAWLGDGYDEKAMAVGTLGLEVGRAATLGGTTLVSAFGRALPATPRAPARPGTLVFTGQPSEYRRPAPHEGSDRRRGGGNPKHHDFVFFAAGKSVRFGVERKVFDDFEFAHSGSGQQHGLNRGFEPNAEWGYWKKALDVGARVPVFFLHDKSGRRVESFGLAMMYRLPYEHSIQEATALVQRRAFDDARDLDLAEGLFGTVRREDDGGANEARALKGRVFISHALAERNSVRELSEVTGILSGPRASYYPNYVEQSERSSGVVGLGVDGKPEYSTWHDGAPRGWKRYRPKAGPYQRNWIPDPPTGENGRPLDLKRVGTTFRPLDAGVRFSSEVVVHNLKPVELGALVWAVRLGSEDSNRRHLLGMARPFGFGRCKLSIGPRGDLRTHRDEPVDLNACVEAFETWMAEQVPGWRDSDTIAELQRLAEPAPAEETRYQRLDPGRRVNEFVEAKRPENGWSLPRATGRKSDGGKGEIGKAKATGGPPPRPTPRPGSSPAPSAPAGAPPSSAQQPPTAGAPGPEPLPPKGTAVRVKLIQGVAGGRWRCQLIPARADVIAVVGGTMPRAVEKLVRPNAEVEVFVVDGSNLRNVQLAWVKPS